MSHSLDTVIIGGGIVGLSCAIELKKKGVNVALIERSKPGHLLACSYGNAGWLTPCFATPLPMPGVLFKSVKWLLDPASPLYIQPRPSFSLLKWLIQFALACNQKQFIRSTESLVRLSHDTLLEFEKLALKYPSLLFSKSGLIVATHTLDGMKSSIEQLRVMEKLKVRGDLLNSAETYALEPALNEGIVGGVFYPNEAQVEPKNAVLTLFNEAQNLGVEFLLEREVFDFKYQKKNPRFELMTTQGSLKANNVVIAGGAWSNLLATRFGIRLPLLGGKGYAITIENPKVQPKHSILCVEKKIAITPKSDGALRVAGTLELVDQNFGITANRVHAIEKGARKFVRLSDELKIREIWRGLRPCTSDGVPIIGWSSKVEGLFWCTGHQMLGLQTSLGSGKLAADLFTHSETTIDTAIFCPKRFGA